MGIQRMRTGFRRHEGPHVSDIVENDRKLVSSQLLSLLNFCNSDRADFTASNQSLFFGGGGGGGLSRHQSNNIVCHVLSSPLCLWLLRRGYRYFCFMSVRCLTDR